MNVRYIIYGVVLWIVISVIVFFILKYNEKRKAKRSEKEMIRMYKERRSSGFKFD